MEQILGSGNGILQYLLVLLVYAGFFVVIRYAHATVDADFRKTFWLLFVVWALGIFLGNYGFYQLNIMSFYPWLNNFIHSFIWIGLCLGFLYAGSYRRPILEQFVLFTMLSFAVKLAEHQILGTWTFDRFFFIDGQLAYLIGWSVVDGFYPILSGLGLKLAARYIKGLAAP
jgi:hypothetical protein